VCYGANVDNSVLGVSCTSYCANHNGICLGSYNNGPMNCIDGTNYGCSDATWHVSCSCREYYFL
jgi:hypothetical protein